MIWFSPFPAERVECPDPADPSAPSIFGRAAKFNYQLEDVERGKPSTKEEANQSLRQFPKPPQIFV